MSGIALTNITAAVQATESDTDGITDASDNCPSVNNLGQEDLDGDGIGDVCDDDVDDDDTCTPGAGQGENDCDADDDNDGKTDADELTDSDQDGVINNPFDPDTDDDGIRDGLDVSPTVDTNVCDPDAGDPENFLNINITGIIQCAAPEGIVVKSGTRVTGTGDLLLITPKATGLELEVKVDGKFSVINEELPEL